MSAVDESLSFNVVDVLLREQQKTTAVEKFAQLHDRHELPLQARYYRDLIPLGTPQPGQQYAFEVDLDACSGCKACVVACHSLNGLEQNEVWRQVGSLHGGCSDLPVIQHVTTTCHHCLEPACLEGCPVRAYEKDPVTGIVRHLDDQCIGCQYCVFKCPYDVPKYSHDKGIVRKCDMCHDRLSSQEAPACVQSCPNEAIHIRIVDKQRIIEESEANQFLPGAPEPGYTLPTTLYKTARPLPRNLLPADYFSARPQHGHLPLVFMLVLTQMSVGAFAIEQLMALFTGWFRDGADVVRLSHLVGALLLGLTGLAASLLHLGRPLYAYRAILGLRTSWLSREILAFGAFAALAAIYTAVAWLDLRGMALPSLLQNGLGGAAAVVGIVAVFCSVMVYADTQRAFWNSTYTFVKFFLTAALLGLPTVLLISLGAAAASDELSVRGIMANYGQWLCGWLLVIGLAKLGFESLVFVHLQKRQHAPLKRTALLLTTELSMTTFKRYFFGFVGIVALPCLLMSESVVRSENGFHTLFIALAVGLMFVVLLIGEMTERYLFFRAVVAPKMPGTT